MSGFSWMAGLVLVLLFEIGDNERLKSSQLTPQVNQTAAKIMILKFFQQTIKLDKSVINFPGKMMRRFSQHVLTIVTYRSSSLLNSLEGRMQGRIKSQFCLFIKLLYQKVLFRAHSRILCR